jgi:short-subunit dehydrogenase
MEAFVTFAQAEFGHIINVSSVGGFVVQPTAAALRLLALHIAQ